MVRYIKQLNEAIFSPFGFADAGDFCTSLISIHTKPIAFASMILGCIATFLEHFVGLNGEMYVVFVILMAFELITGIRASMKEGQQFQSRPLGRFIIKSLVYTLLLGAIHTLSRNYVATAFGYELNVYGWMHFTIFNIIIIQLIRSVLENLDRLGFREASKIYKVIATQTDRWFANGEIKSTDKKVNTEDNEQGA